MKAEGLGTAVFETNGGLGRIDNILHCPTLSSNLLSVGRLDRGDRGSDGTASLFCDGEYFILPKPAIRSFIRDNRHTSILIGQQANDLLYYVSLKCKLSSSERKSATAFQVDLPDDSKRQVGEQPAGTPEASNRVSR